jgi:hypothetical protein
MGKYQDWDFNTSQWEYELEVALEWDGKASSWKRFGEYGINKPS